MKFLALLSAEASGAQQGGGSWLMIILIYGVILGAFYFFAIRPQKKKQKAQDEMISAIEVGDSVLTTSGFYGVIIDISDSVVIVEFGSNKNCRIPMKKEAIVEVEKAH
ncbi:MAG: preprotein translocase subunit YajC [Lachnospiraceae bacterium]|nr:preprotein translocase subunit YajC [Lachnospiraceae bacterium]